MRNAIQTLPTVDVTGEAPVLPGSPSGHVDHAVHGLVTMPYRVPHLTVCRESNEYDHILLQGLVQQTLAFNAGRPATERARDLGIRPLLDPAGCGVAVAPLTCGRAKGVLFEVDGDYFLYAMTSAAKSNDKGENDWTHLVVGAMQALRPEILQVASLSRLVRSFDHSALLLHAVSRHVDEVRAGGTVMRMRGEGSETGHLLWSMLSMVAASERTLIQQRLTAGVVAKYRRGEWVMGKGAVPLGFRLDPESKSLVPDPGQAEALRMAFIWLADPQLTKWEIVRRLGDLGVTTDRLRKSNPDATVADFRSPEMYVNQLLRWAPLYRNGTWVTHWPNPFEGALHIAGMPVVRDNGREELHFAYDFGRPDVDPSFIDAALSVRSFRTTARETGGASHKRAPAFSCTTWVQDGISYWLEPSSDATYELRVRAAGEVTA